MPHSLTFFIQCINPMSQTQLERDIAFCIDICGMEDEEIGDMLRACERLGGISVEYFCEEFVFIPFDEYGVEDQDSLQNIHDDDYLNIAEFNAMYWEQ